jgi:hypothetical protein
VSNIEIERTWRKYFMSYIFSFRMLLAIKEVSKGMSTYAAALKHQVSQATLYRRRSQQMEQFLAKVNRKRLKMSKFYNFLRLRNDKEDEKIKSKDTKTLRKNLAMAQFQKEKAEKAIEKLQHEHLSAQYDC